jgi:hypothetical protein
VGHPTVAQDAAFDSFLISHVLEKTDDRTVAASRHPVRPQDSRFVQIEEAAPTAVTGDRTGGRMRY